MWIEAATAGSQQVGGYVAPAPSGAAFGDRRGQLRVAPSLVAGAGGHGGVVTGGRTGREIAGAVRLLCEQGGTHDPALAGEQRSLRSRAEEGVADGPDGERIQDASQERENG